MIEAGFLVYLRTSVFGLALSGAIGSREPRHHPEPAGASREAQAETLADLRRVIPVPLLCFLLTTFAAMCSAPHVSRGVPSEPARMRFFFAQRT